MPKPTATKEVRWRIFQFRKTLTLLGWVYAPDEKTALEKGADECGIRPVLGNRLMAQRQG
jgi:hypothetical protein